MSENLWPIITIQDEQTPLDLLKEQAVNIEQVTSGSIIGEVESETEGNLFRHKFYIIPKYIRNYRFLMIEIIHGLYLYPVYFYDHTKKIAKPRTESVLVPKSPLFKTSFETFATMYDTIPSDIPTPDCEINDFINFKEKLRETFNNETTITIIKTLLFQSK